MSPDLISKYNFQESKRAGIITEEVPPPISPSSNNAAYALWHVMLNGIYYFRDIGVNRVKKVLGLSQEELAHALGVSSRTVSLMERLEDRLPFVASDRVYRITRILVLAIEVFKKQEGAVEWLREPQIALGGRTPFDTLLSEPGSREVENLLGRIEHGVIS